MQSKHEDIIQAEAVAERIKQNGLCHGARQDAVLLKVFELMIVKFPRMVIKGSEELPHLNYFAR